MSITTLDLGQLDCWPLGSFAPGGYSGKCHTCNVEFEADKRSRFCLSCEIKLAKTQTTNGRDTINSLKYKIEEEQKYPIERIAAAAIFSGVTFSLPPPARHHTILGSMSLVLGIDAMEHGASNAQGFITTRGRFVNRVEAFYIAQAAGQIIHKSGNITEPTLYSEDMW